MNIASAIAFDTAEREYNDAWNAPSNTRFELPPVDVNKVLKERYRVIPGQTLTRAMIWDMETKKGLGPAHLYPLCGFAGSLMGPNDSARRLGPVLPVVIAARMDHVGGRARA
jgi:hypothetical protein